MSNNEKRSAGPQLRSGPLITGAALFGAGALLALAGLAVGGSYLLSATRRWIRELAVAPTAPAELQRAQAEAAATPASAAWQNGPSARPASDRSPPGGLARAARPARPSAVQPRG